jgi:hypothetical protein
MELHHVRLHHLARRITQLGGGGGGTPSRAAAPPPQSAAALSRYRSLKRGAVERAAAAASLPWPPRAAPDPPGGVRSSTSGGGATARLRPRPQTAPVARPRSRPGLRDGELDPYRQSGPATADAAGREEWLALKRRLQHPGVAPAVGPLALPPSRFNGGGPPLLPGVQARCYRRALLQEIVERRLFKVGWRVTLVVVSCSYQQHFSLQ